jgi:hypothetical protein
VLKRWQDEDANKPICIARMAWNRPSIEARLTKICQFSQLPGGVMLVSLLLLIFAGAVRPTA